MAESIAYANHSSVAAVRSDRRRKIAMVLILIVDVGFVAWGAAAAISPDHLLGPGGKAILPAGYEGFSNLTWADLESSAPMAAAYMTLLFRTYGIFNVVIGLTTSAIAFTAFRRGERWASWTLLVANVIALVAAMIYDKTVNAIGPFEISEYVGLAMVLIAFGLAIRSERAADSGT